MNVSYLKPALKIADYVQEILVIDNYPVSTPFVLPLFANGKPTLLFQTAKGHIGNATNHLTLFGQTVFPSTLTIKENFTLIAYFFKPYALNSLFGVAARELTDSPVDLNLLSPAVRANLQEQLLNASSTSETDLPAGSLYFQSYHQGQHRCADHKICGRKDRRRSLQKEPRGSTAGSLHDAPHLSAHVRKKYRHHPYPIPAHQPV